MVRNSTERLDGDYDLEPRGSAVSCTLLRRSQATFQPSASVVLYCFERGDVLIDHLYCSTVLPQIVLLFPRGLCFRTYGFKRNLHLLTRA